MVERLWAPFTEPEFELQPMQVCLVYISQFTNDNINIAYYIRETHITRFLAGTFGMQAYDGPALITPIGFSSREGLVKSVTRIGSTSSPQLRVNKNDAHLEKVRWRYLFKTARTQWAKLEFDPTRWVWLKDQIQAAPKPTMGDEQATRTYASPFYVYDDVDEDKDVDKDENNANLSDEWDVSSVTSCQAQNILKTTGRKMAKAGGIEEPGGDDENLLDIPTGDAGRSDSDSPAPGIDILKLLDSILRSGGKPDDLLAYLAKRDVHGNFVGAKRLKEKVVGLVDTLSLIDDQQRQNRHNEAIGVEVSDIAEEELMDYYHTRDELIADIHRIRALPEESRDNSSDSSDDDDDNLKATPSLSKQKVIILTDMVSMATAQPSEIAIRLLQRNNWDVGDAIEYWFDMEDQGISFGDEGLYQAWDSLLAPQIMPTHQASLASSSGVKSQKEATPEDLAADRARLERLIAHPNTVPHAQQPIQQKLSQQNTRPSHTLNDTKKPSLKLRLKSQTPTPASSSPAQPTDVTGTIRIAKGNAYTTTPTFPGHTRSPSSANKRQISQNFQTMTADALASIGKKRMMEAPHAKQQHQQAMSSEEGLALLEQAVQINKKSMGNMTKLAAMAKEKLDKIEEARRDSAMDTGAMITARTSTRGMDAIQMNTGKDREAFAEERDGDDEVMGEGENVEGP